HEGYFGTDLVMLNYSQMKRTPELEPPLQTSEPHQPALVWTVMVNRSFTVTPKMSAAGRIPPQG
ncbi:hypothetical protein AVEN_23851-1, partial [Araneus ventricosus]